MRASFKTLLGALGALLLASCGGGGGDDQSNSGFGPSGVRVTVTSASATSTPNSLVPITVRVENPNGAPLPSGTEVTLRVSPPGVGLVSSLQVAGTPNQSGSIVLSESVTAPLSSGGANFRLHTRSIGTATLTASIRDERNGFRVVEGSTAVNVAAGPGTDTRLTIQAQTTTLPIRPRTASTNTSFFLGSPYVSEITVTWRNLDGTIAVPRDDEDEVAAAIAPGLGPAAIVQLDDPRTGSENEFIDANGNIRLWQSIARLTNGGRMIFFVISDSLPGPATLTVSAVDQLTGETLSAQTIINVQSGAPALPGTVVIEGDTIPVYIQGVNGDQTKPFDLFVRDGAGTFVPNPPAGVNNAIVEIVGGAQGGERLRGINGAGQTVTGERVSLRTIGGTSSFIYESGTRSGVITLRATSDRADNNVDNGVQDAVTSTRGLAVSDGRLFDIELTFPTRNAVFVPPALLPGQQGVEVDVDPPFTIIVPPRPDGTYRLTVSAVAVDRFGNPVPPGTEIRFGLIDHPLTRNFFSIAGNDGDPQESGTLFTAPTGTFTSAGGGAGPGDTLLVFGEDSPGNRDLEAARTIQAINSATSLSVQRRFNANDDTGATVNNGPVLPYVIGRATTGAIQISGITNSAGVATVDLTYPVSQVGRLSAVWAQGSGDIVSGQAELVTDIELVPFPGISPGTLTADPSQIPGNSTQDVTVCVRDVLGVGVQGLTISFAFENLNGTGSVDGRTGSGTVANPTGAGGCTIARVTTTGVVPPPTGGGGTQNTPRVRFSFGGLSDTVDILAGQLVLQAIPSAFTGDGTVTITLRLLDGAGNPVPGVQLSGTCEADAPGSLSIVTPPGVTNAQGETTARVQADGFNVIDDTPPTGTCTFTTPTGTPEAIVTFNGLDLCDVGVSPVPAGCPTGTLVTVTLNIPANAAAGMPVAIQSGPPGITCSAAAGAAQTCTGQFQQGVTVSLSASIPVSWTGSCAPAGGANPTLNASLTASGSPTCTATRTP